MSVSSDVRPAVGRPPARDQSLQRRLARGLTRDRTAVIVHWLSLVGSYLALWLLLLNTWFHGDDFEFLANRVGDSPRLGIWAAHVNHWSTLPILIWRALYAAFGVSSSAPYFAVSLFMHVLAGHLLWRLMLRSGISTWPATALAASFLVLGAGWENITWAFQLGFLGAFALGLASMLLCLRRSRIAFAFALLLSLAALMFSGIGTVMAIGSTLTLLLLRRFVRAILLAVCTGAAYGVWSMVEAAQIHSPPHGMSLLGRMSNAPSWTWQLLGSAYGTYTAIASVGGVLAVLLVIFGVRQASEAGSIWRRDTADPDRLRLVTWVAVTGTAVIQVLSFAVTRNDISPPGASRYLYFVIALSLPLIGVLLSRLSRKTWQAVLVGIFLVYLIGEQGLLLAAQERQFENPPTRAQADALGRLVADGQPIYSIALAPDLNSTSIKKWVREHALGPLDHIPAQDLLDARARGQVAVLPGPPSGSSGATAVQVAGRPAPTLAPHSCVAAHIPPDSVAATASLQPGRVIAVTLASGGVLTYRVVEGTAVSWNQHAKTSAAEKVWMTAAVPLAVQIVAAPGEHVTVCTP